MALADIPREAVQAALTEFDRLGREEFLRQYRFGPAKTYYLVANGREYDSKAIIGYAHGVHPGPRWTTDDFTGGEGTVAKHLRRLGFDVPVRRNPDWTRDEIILACDLVAQNGWRSLDAKDSRVVALSELLQQYDAHPLATRAEDFRNPNGVGRKTADLTTRHPNYTGAPTRGGKTDLEVLADFIAMPDQMHRAAAAIRAAILSGEASLSELGNDDRIIDLDLDDASAVEGGVLERRHLRYERDRGLRNKAVAAYKKKHGTVACEACSFNFAAVYGKRGEDYIECHHRVPVSESGQVKNRIADLVMLCSNCHRMIHRERPWLSFEQLVELLDSTGIRS